MFGRALVLPESPVVSAARGGGLGVSAVRGTRVNVVVHMLKRESRGVVARRYRDADRGICMRMRGRQRTE